MCCFKAVDTTTAQQLLGLGWIQVFVARRPLASCAKVFHLFSGPWLPGRSLPNITSRWSLAHQATGDKHHFNTPPVSLALSAYSYRGDKEVLESWSHALGRDLGIA